MKSYIASDIKDLNRKIVYDYIRSKEVPVVSRAEIVRSTKISAPTVLKIIGYFIEKNIVFELSEPGSSNVGRKPFMLQFNPNAAYAIGVGYNGKKLDIAIINLNYEVVCKESISIVLKSLSGFGELICSYTDELLEKNYIPRNKILCLGIALPGIIDTSNCLIIKPNIKLGVDGPVNFREECDIVKNHFSCPVIIENDVNSASTAEFYMRGMNYNEDLVLLLLDDGYGAGIILDGKLRRGKHYSSGEIGYMVTIKDTAGSGFTFLENTISHAQIFDALGIDLNRDHISAAESQKVSEYIAPYVSSAVISLANSLDVDCFVICGNTFERISAELMPKIVRYAEEHCLRKISISESICTVIPVSMGVASIAIDSFIEKFLSD